MYQPSLSISAFAESPLGLGLNLTPVQKFVLKLLHCEDLDSRKPSIKIPRKWENVGSNDPNDFLLFTEIQYLDHLLREGRASLPTAFERPEVSTIVVGRRGGKSFLQEVSALYDIYALLEDPDPWETASSSVKGSMLSVGISSVNRHTLKSLHQVFHDLCQKVPFLDNRSSSSTNSSEYFRRVGFDDSESVRVQFLANATNLRGFSFHRLYLDEAAYFPDLRSFLQASWPALGDRGSIALFTTEKEGDSHFSSIYDVASESSRGLALRIPTWEIQPDLPNDIYAKSYRSSPRTFGVEWAAGRGS